MHRDIEATDCPGRLIAGWRFRKPGSRPTRWKCPVCKCKVYSHLQGVYEIHPYVTLEETLRRAREL
jgi:hypothetical protein